MNCQIRSEKRNKAKVQSICIKGFKLESMLLMIEESLVDRFLDSNVLSIKDKLKRIKLNKIEEITDSMDAPLSSKAS